MGEVTRAQEQGVRDQFERDRLVSKGDLDDAKSDLRREMKLWLGAGSALGTALSGVFAAQLAPQAVQQVEALARASGLF